MKVRYSFAVLRYVHDVVTGEFVNVGVLLYAPQAKYLEMACLSTYGRLSGFFGPLDGEHFKRMMRQIETGVRSAASRIFTELFERTPEDALACAVQVLPADDSSLQFAPGGGGMAEESTFGKVLDRTFERYVTQYSQRPVREARTDAEIWPAFRNELQAQHVLAALHPKRVTAPDYDHEFPLAWKNGIWNAAEAVSFDLTDTGSVVEKANRWLGRGVNLRDSSEQFKLYLLVGEPRSGSDDLHSAFARAMNILRKMPLRHELISERDARAFALRVKEDLAAHVEEEDGTKPSGVA